MANQKNDFSNVLPILQAALNDAKFVRYNIPDEFGNTIRPLAPEDSRELQSLNYLYRSGKWNSKATELLLELSKKAHAHAKALEELLLDNGYDIVSTRVKERTVVTRKSPLGEPIVFTWMLPEYEEYDGGLLDQVNDDDFVKEVMEGKYDDKYTKRYLSHMYKTKEVREGVSPSGEMGYNHYFVERNEDVPLTEEELTDDNTNLSDLNLL